MKREMLKEMGLTDEQIDKIMGENGKDIETHKTAAETQKTTAEGYKTQLEEANKTIEGFKAMDIDGIKAASEKYKTDFEQAQKDHAAALSKIAYDSAADKFIDTLKPKDMLSKKAILAEFSAKGFKLEGENFVGGNEWAEQFKKDNAAHFDDGKPAPGIFSGRLGGPGQDVNVDVLAASMRKAAGLPDTSQKI